MFGEIADKYSRVRSPTLMVHSVRAIIYGRVYTLLCDNTSRDLESDRMLGLDKQWWMVLKKE